MEQMDNIFGGNQGEQDMLRMQAIRNQLSLSCAGKDVEKPDDHSAHVEEVERG